jgi:uncharacterized protein with HEPN domain
MKGMRNRIAHGYFDINLDVVWETVQMVQKTNPIKNSESTYR